MLSRGIVCCSRMQVLVGAVASVISVVLSSLMLIHAVILRLPFSLDTFRTTSIILILRQLHFTTAIQQRTRPVISQQARLFSVSMAAKVDYSVISCIARYKLQRD